MHIALVLGYTALFLFIIHRWKFFHFEGVSNNFLKAVFLLKILAGVGLWWIYTYYYTDRIWSDIYKYFDDAEILFQALFTAPGDYLLMLTGLAPENEHFLQNYFDQMNHWFKPYEDGLYNDARLVIKFNAVVRLFSFGHFNVHTVFMCFVSLIGLTAIYKALRQLIAEHPRLLAGAVFLVPSVLFWGSGVLKEGLLFLALGLMLLHSFRLIQGTLSWVGIISVLLCTPLLLVLKLYIFIGLLPALVAFWWCCKRPKLSWLKYGAVLVLCAVVALNLHHIWPGHNVLEVLVRKQGDFINLATEYGSGSLFAFQRLEPTLVSFITSTPAALYSVFLKPMPWELAGPFSWVALAENLLLITTLIFGVLFAKKMKDVNWNLFLFLITFTFIVALLIGWVTPVTGGIVRYKAPLLPFLLSAFLVLLDREKLTTKIPLFRFL